MSAAKAHRYLVSFQRLGLVTQDARTARYDLGPAALKLGLACWRGWMPCGWRASACPAGWSRSAPWRWRCGATMAPTIVHWEESPQAVTANLRLGDVMPLLSSATGRCFAAYMPPKPWRPAAARAGPGRQAAAHRPPPRWSRRRTVLADVRERGMAGGGHAAARHRRVLRPVFDAGGHLALGITTLGSVATFDPEWGGAIEVPCALPPPSFPPTWALAAHEPLRLPQACCTARAR